MVISHERAFYAIRRDNSREDFQNEDKGKRWYVAGRQSRNVRWYEVGRVVGDKKVRARSESYDFSAA